jgi:azurin
MRIIFALPLLAMAACSVDNDTANDQMTLEYNQQQIEDAARDAGRTAKEVGASVGNVAASTGRAIKNEVGDIDVDVDVTRNRTRDTGNEADANHSVSH